MIPKCPPPSNQADGSKKPRLSLSSFAKDKNGSVAMMFAGALVPVVVFIGMSLDYARAQRIQTIMQSAADAASMAAATSTGDDAAKITIAQNVFTANANLARFGISSTPSVNVTSNSVTLTANANVPTSFMKLVNVNSVPLQVTSGVASSGKTLELAIVLDVTGSMGNGPNSKLEDMKWAAKDLIDIVMPTGGGNSPTRVALVPFSDHVNAGTYASAVTGLAPTYTTGGFWNNNLDVDPDDAWNSSGVMNIKWDHELVGPDYAVNGLINAAWDNLDAKLILVGKKKKKKNNDDDDDDDNGGSSNNSGGSTKYLNPCVTERQDSLTRYTDDEPTTNQYVGSYLPGSSTEAQYSTSGACDIPVMMPLTTDRTALRSHIDSFSASNTTAGHIGTAWGMYAVSPKWNSVWPSHGARDYTDTKNIKAVVIMTDGAYNKDYTSGKTSTEMALELCSTMKASDKNIIVYTIGFAIPVNSSQRQTLMTCATSSSHYFFPYDGDELRQAFKTIGQALSSAQGSARITN